jgi:hypothetical protein
VTGRSERGCDLATWCRSDGTSAGHQVRDASKMAPIVASSVASNSSSLLCAEPFGERPAEAGDDTGVAGEAGIGLVAAVAAGQRHHSQDLRVGDVRFAGDSGDGMQLTGTASPAPAPCSATTWPRCRSSRPRSGRPPAPSPASRRSRSTSPTTTSPRPGDAPNVLVAMNPAALRKRAARLEGRHGHRQRRHLRPSATSPRPATRNPLEDGSLDGYTVYEVPMTSLTKEAVRAPRREAPRRRAVEELLRPRAGVVDVHPPGEPTLEWIEQKFAKDPRSRRQRRRVQGRARLRRDRRAVRPPLRGQARAPRPGHLHQHHGNTALAWGSSPPASWPSCRCSSGRTPSPRPPTSSTSCRSTRTSASAPCRPRTRSPASARPSAPPSAATSASPPPRAGRGAQGRDHRAGGQPRAAAARRRHPARRSLHRPAHQDRGRPTCCWRCTAATASRRCRSWPPTARRTASTPPSRRPASRSSTARR